MTGIGRADRPLEVDLPFSRSEHTVPITDRPLDRCVATPVRLHIEAARTAVAEFRPAVPSQRQQAERVGTTECPLHPGGLP